MTYETITIDNREGIVLLTINRPSALNAINSTVMSELNSFFSKDHTSIENLKGVMITGSGDKAFVAGADIKEFASLDLQSGMDKSRFGQKTFSMIENFHTPVIAVVNGFALGGGCELAMSCHMRIASNNAKFGQPEVNLGMIAGYGATQRLPQLIGKSKAMELLLTADMIGTDDALRLGLVNRVADSKDEAIDMAQSMIKKISSKGPIAVAKTIQAINAYYDEKQDGYDVEITSFGECLESADAKEGALAFVEKRKANFTGK